MTYHTVADTPVSSIGDVYFVGPGALFSRVALRTVETELDVPTQRVPDMEALRIARERPAGAVDPAYMVVVHETCARALLDALAQGAAYLPQRRLAITFDSDETVGTLFADIRDELLHRRVSLLPMNTNVTNWVRLLQVIQSGGQYLPPELLQAETATTAEEASPRPAPEPVPLARMPVPRERAPGAPVTPAHAPRAQDGLTPRESEVLAMAAAGSPNKTIAGALELSEHTVKLYMHRIIGKLGVRNRTEAAVWYHQNSTHA